MHYPDEPYVRKYPRKTLTWHKLGWEGRAVKDAMLGEFDRAGIFVLDGDAAECVALVTGIPVEVVRVGLERCIATKTFRLTETALVWPNYVHAQTCAKSDKARQAESRARRAEEASGTAPSEGDVTTRHDPSRNVTPNLAQPNSTDPISSERERDDREGEPEVEPRPRRRRTRRPRSYWQFPEGWKWSAATAAKAAAAGITERELVAQVDYWTIHIWAVEVTDLDGELVRLFDNIKERRAKASTEPASNPYAWAPTAEHRAFATSKGLPLQIAVDAYRAGGLPDKLGTLVAHDDFMRRLRCWAATGEFHATGPLPKPLREPARGAA